MVMGSSDFCSAEVLKPTIVECMLQVCMHVTGTKLQQSCALPWWVSTARGMLTGWQAGLVHGQAAQADTF